MLASPLRLQPADYVRRRAVCILAQQHPQRLPPCIPWRCLYWFGLSLTLFTLALLTHETAVVFPLIVTAYEYLRSRRIQLGRIAAFWAVAALYFVVRKLVLGEAAPLDITNPSAWSTLFGFAVAYLETLFIPWPQFPYMAVPVGGIAAPTGGVLALLLLVGMAVLLRLRVPDKTVMLFGLSWIVLALAAPILAALNATPLFAFRSLYLPSIGVSILVAWMVAVSLQKYRPVVWAAIGLSIMVAMATTLMVNRDWLSNARVYEKMLLVTPNLLGPVTTLADIYDKRGDEAAAERILLQAAEQAQKNDPTLDEVHEHLGLLYGKRGDMPMALQAYLTAINADPKNYEAVYNTALAYRQVGNQALAELYFQRALTMQ